ncbi:hypothetical protein CLI92_06510 [Vandammella animalimorsus]|uniref:DUF1800 domain-containing protein n=1 Tax=Vandammella animalimorsus TaxID=2029117 RepID=A0A2A2T5C6_9BURK|nr:DUF1800 family protein [Vandammella animalimorsus]PAT30903.1 hypothetical protein CK626_12970 [Vandammella animalimorsus]PAX16766.1 hypothetical protein CLI92_06510 [Vandammella animalimorsus]PAX20436.1 hypothetical protein CLI93_01400 [Vandammella animalimorsus]
MPRPQTPAEAAAFILRAQYYVTEQDIADVMRLGYEPWLDGKLGAAQSEMTGWDWLLRERANRMSALYSHEFATHMMWALLMSPVDGLRKRVALALSEIFVISNAGLPIESPSFAVAAYWDMLMRNALGNYRTLLTDVSLSPAMGVYLSSRGNRRGDPQTGRIPDENYAREVMQLFSIGLYELNQDGSLKMAGDKPIETYTQETVTNLAQVFTGWDFDPRNHVQATRPENVRNPMAVKPEWHSSEDVHIFGQTIAGATPPRQKLDRALDVLFQHPNVGPFIGRQLIQRLVTSHPSRQYVARVAAAFANNGAGERGDMKAVLKAIFLDPEAMAAGQGRAGRTFGKLREPMLRVAQWGATFKARKNPKVAASGTFPLWSLAEDLGQSPFDSASVFNFFRPGFVPPHTEMAAQGITAPEFQIMDEYTVVRYINLMTALVRDWYPVAGVYTAELALATKPQQLVERMNLLLAGGQLSPETMNTITQAVQAVPLDWEEGDKNRVCAAILLVMSCPEYIVQK